MTPPERPPNSASEDLIAPDKKVASPVAQNSAAPEAIYRAPLETPAPVTGALSTAELRTAAYVIGAWLFAASLLAGLAVSLETGHALGVFGAESWLVWVVAISFLRRHGASAAASAAVVAIATLQHRRVSAGAELPRTRDLWPVLSAVPIGAVLSACLMTAVAIVIALSQYGIAAATSWTKIAEHLQLSDIPVGMATAAVFACGIALIARLTRQRSATTRRGLLIRIAAGLVFLTAWTGALDFALTVIWTGTSDSKPLLDTVRDGPRG